MSTKENVFIIAKVEHYVFTVEHTVNTLRA